MNALIITLSMASFAAQKGGGTSDPSITWTIYSGYQRMSATLMHACDPTTTGCTASAVKGDGSTYSNGSNGVSNSNLSLRE